MTEILPSDLPILVLRALETYRDAVLTRDVDAFMALYHHDVRVFDTWGSWSMDGAASLRGNIERWFGTLGTDVVVISFDGIRTIEQPGTIIVTAVVSYKGVSADGIQLRSMENRLTWALAREVDVWKIVHEHTSVPLDPEDGKGIMRRTKGEVTT